MGMKPTCKKLFTFQMTKIEKKKKKSHPDGTLA